MHLLGIWMLMAALQVVVLVVKAEGSSSSKQGLLPCMRGFTQKEYILKMDKELAKGQAIFNEGYRNGGRDTE
ncbi:hypothetical protein PAMP_024985 [Pampus punctatissimus]